MVTAPPRADLNFISATDNSGSGPPSVACELLESAIPVIIKNELHVRRNGYETMGTIMDLSRFDNSDFDRGASRWKEAVWVATRCLFFQNPLPWPSALRAGLLRMFGAKVGRGAVIRVNVNISHPWRLSLGDHVWIGEDVGILSLAQVTIGSNVCISQRAYLCTGSHDFRREDFALTVAPIVVHDGSWIAAMSFIAPGVEIGSGSVVSAGSVVFTSVPAGAFVKPAASEILKN